MLRSLSLWICLLGILEVTASAFPRTAQTQLLQRRDSSRSGDSSDPSSTICGDIIDDVNLGYTVFYASAAYDCLRSVPFNEAVALRFIDYYNTTIQFQTTVQLLQNPPDGYQQPAVDLQQGLTSLRNNVTANLYKNQYAFEVDLQYLIYQAHDTHVDLSAGVLASFTFGSPYSIVSASIDGKEVPKVWFRDDILSYTADPNGPVPSPIVSINGEEVVSYLTRFAALNSQGTLEPHGDWNQLMSSPALDIQASVTAFDGDATFYPGDELNFTLADGTVNSTRWVAFYNEPYFTGPLSTSGDYYNYFVLGLLPASYDEVPLPDVFNTSINFASQLYLDDFESITDWTSVTSAYPNDTVVAQDNLGVGGSALLTGYLLPEISTAVLSIPTFSEFDEDMQPFSNSIDYFIANATSKGMKKVVIDLQQNWGGDVLLAFSTFKQFFPQATPFAGSQRRIHQVANILGKTYTEFWDGLSLENDAEDKLQLEGTEWVITPRINAETEKNFTSWDEYAGPRAYGGDSFSVTERYNLTNPLFDQSAFDGWIPGDYVTQSAKATPYDASDIVILTDGLCASACTLLLEMMTQAGVKTVTVGGRPESGPIQAASGTRGAAAYTAAELDADFYNASWIVSTKDDRSDLATLAPLVTSRDKGMWINYAGITLRDQVRSTDDPEPLQLKYQAADCRIYWSIDNIFNFTRLWSDAVTATWSDQSLCVDGSTGYTTNSGSGTTTTKAPPAKLFDWAPALPITPGVDFDANRGGLSDAKGGSNTIHTIIRTTQSCKTTVSGACSTELGLFCQPTKKGSTAGYCASSCSSTDTSCRVADQACKLSRKTTESGSNSPNGQFTVSSFNNPVKLGVCAPKKTK